MKRYFMSRRRRQSACAPPFFVAAALAVFCAAIFATTGQAQSWAQSYGARSYDASGAPVASAGVGYGFLYYDPSVEAFWDSIKRAREIFHGNPDTWASLVRRAMSQSFAWETAASRYEELYRTLEPAAGRAAA
jgi:hypothetical protein